MAQINVKVNGRSYAVGCDDGQEEHVGYLAEYIDKRMQELVGTVGQVGEARLMLLAALLIADDLSELYDRIEALERQAEQGGHGAVDADAAIGALADRLETVAERLESA